MKLSNATIAEHTEISLKKLKARRIDKLIDLWKNNFVIDDFDPLKILLATIVANELDGDPLWIQAIGPSSSGKTEMANALIGYPNVQIMGDLTPQAIFSGHTHNKKKKPPGLLQQMIENGERYKMLIFKDASTIINKRYEDAAIIFSYLRKIYDGKFSKIFGVHVDEKYLQWEGKIGVIMLGTQQLEKNKPMQQAMGERFLTVRLKPVEDQERKIKIALAAMGNAEKIDQIRLELRDNTASFLKHCSQYTKHLKDLEQDIAKLALFTAKGRQAVLRDSYTREIEDVVPEEGVPRVAKQLMSLAKGLTIIHEGEISKTQLLHLLRRVAIDSIPATRNRIITYFYKPGYDSWQETKDIAKELNLPPKSTLRSLEDMFVIKLLERRKKNLEDSPGRRPYEWRVTEELDELLITTKMVESYETKT